MSLVVLPIIRPIICERDTHVYYFEFCLFYKSDKGQLPEEGLGVHQEKQSSGPEQLSLLLLLRFKEETKLAERHTTAVLIRPLKGILRGRTTPIVAQHELGQANSRGGQQRQRSTSSSS